MYAPKYCADWRKSRKPQIQIYALSSCDGFLPPPPRGQWVCCWGAEQRQMRETSSGRHRCMWLLPTGPLAAQRPCWPSWATWTWQIALAERPCTTQLRAGSRRQVMRYWLPILIFFFSRACVFLKIVFIADGEAAAEQRGQPECHR